MMNGWMIICDFTSFLNSISVISGRWKGDNAVCSRTPFTTEMISIYRNRTRDH